MDFFVRVDVEKKNNERKKAKQSALQMPRHAGA